MLIDRLEELLSILEDEDDNEEEWERATALTGRTFPGAVFPEEADGEAVPTGDGGRRPPTMRSGAGRPDRDAGETAEADGLMPGEEPGTGLAWTAKTGGMEAPGAEQIWTVKANDMEEPEAGLAWAEKTGSMEELETGLVWAAETGGMEEPGTEPMWTAKTSGVEEPGTGLARPSESGAVTGAQAAWRRVREGRSAQLDAVGAQAVRTAVEGAAQTVQRSAAEAARAALERRSAEQGEALGRTVRHERESGLEELYRQTAQAFHPVSQTVLVEQAGRTVRAEEPGRTAALTVDELDRAVRRDSRRYDGGMMIY